MTYDVDCPFVGLFAGCCDLNIYALLKLYPDASVLRVGFGFQKWLGHKGCAFVSGISNPHKGLTRGSLSRSLLPFVFRAPWAHQTINLPWTLTSLTFKAVNDNFLGVFFFCHLNTRNASQICMPSLHRSQANLLRIVPVSVRAAQVSIALCF